jgi:hypothetical protein
VVVKYYSLHRSVWLKLKLEHLKGKENYAFADGKLVTVLVYRAYAFSLERCDAFVIFVELPKHSALTLYEAVELK